MPSADATYCSVFVDTAVQKTVASPKSVEAAICVRDMLSDANFYELRPVRDALPNALRSAVQGLQDSMRRALRKLDKPAWEAASRTAKSLQSGDAVEPPPGARFSEACSSLLDSKRQEFEHICSFAECLPHHFLTQQHAQSLLAELQQCGVLLLSLQFHRGGGDGVLEQSCGTLRAMTDAMTRVLCTAHGDFSSEQCTDVNWVLSWFKAAVTVSETSVAALDGPLYFSEAVASTAMWVSQLIAHAGAEIASPILADLSSLLSEETLGKLATKRRGGTQPCRMLICARACIGHYVLSILSVCNMLPPDSVMQALEEHAIGALTSLVDGDDHFVLFSEHVCGILAAITDLNKHNDSSVARLEAVAGLSCRLMTHGGGKHATRCLRASLRALHTSGCLNKSICEVALHAMLRALPTLQQTDLKALRTDVLDTATAMGELVSNQARSEMVHILMRAIEDAVTNRANAAPPLQLLCVLLTVHSHIEETADDGDNLGDRCAAVAMQAIDSIARSEAASEAAHEIATAAVRMWCAVHTMF